MIRKTLESGYNRTVGAFLSWLSESASSAARKTDILQVVYIVAIIALMAGFVDAVVNPVPNQSDIIYQGDGLQSIPETLINSFVILLGGVGIYLTYLSGRQTTRARAVNLYLGLALLLIIVAILTGVDVANIKGI